MMDFSSAPETPVFCTDWWRAAVMAVLQHFHLRFQTHRGQKLDPTLTGWFH